MNTEDSLLGSTRVLLVDGDKAVRSAMERYFRKITGLFVTVKSAEEALPLLDGPLWDIIVCDLILPGMNGIDFCKRVNRLKPGIKLIMGTHYPVTDVEARKAEYGIVEIVRSPISPDQLLAILIKVFALNGAMADSTEAPPNKKIGTGLTEPETVSILELDESMIIEAYIRFGDQYKSISPPICTWVQKNFKGAWAVVRRGTWGRELMVNDLLPGDCIGKIHRFPVSLMNLIFVRKQLINELKERGFLAFSVRKKPSRPSVLQKARLEAVCRTERLIEKVGESVSIRETATETIRDLFSKDDDQINTFDLVNLVERIADNDTAHALSLIAALKKSDHTYAHCIDVGAIYWVVSAHWYQTKGIASKFQNEAEVLLSAILHDIGKITLPKDIIENTAGFDASGPEMRMIKEHPIRGAHILTKLKMSKTAVNMARYHHVKMDTAITSSYPSIDSYRSVLPETRLLGIVDMFQAMIGQRPYRKAWHPAAAMKYIDQLAGVECDPQAWIAFREAMGWYPVGSLVKLNDGSEAFVVERAHNGLHRPVVMVTRNAYDEELTHNTLIDLERDKDAFIKKGLNHFDIYGDNALDRFLQLRAS